MSGGERAVVEHVGHEAHVLDDGDRLAVADRHARRLLAAVLQGVEAEVGEVGDRLARGVDAEDAARLRVGESSSRSMLGSGVGATGLAVGRRPTSQLTRSAAAGLRPPTTELSGSAAVDRDGSALRGAGAEGVGQPVAPRRDGVGQRDVEQALDDSRSPPATPIGRRARRRSRTASSTVVQQLGGHAEHDPRRATRRTARTRRGCRPHRSRRPERTAISASARPRPPSTRRATPATRPPATSVAHQVGDRGVRGRGRARASWPPRWPSVPGPRRAGEQLRRRRRRASTRRPPVDRPTPGGRRSRRSTTPSMPTTGVGSMSTPAVSL